MVSKSRVISLMSEVLKNGSKCSAHSNFVQNHGNKCKSETSDYAFEISCSNLRYGPGVNKELGMDVINFNSKKALLITDKNVSILPSFNVATNSLSRYGVKFDLYDEVKVEPTDVSIMHAVDFARQQREPYDIFIAIGGGSVMDTTKVVNLLTADRDAHLLDYAAPPTGKGKLITVALKPLIALPTTSGTGSETTGVAIFDCISMKTKLGISNRVLKPTLGLVDPDHTAYLPRDVACYSGFDVLCHALESYTAIPYNKRTPRPSNPIERPAYQGSNPISDVWSIQALHIIEKYFRRSINDPSDSEARTQMHLAGSLAGMGFGNAGVHLCHGMSYPISGLAKLPYPNINDYKPTHDDNKNLIPHGLSVVINAPAVFKFTSKLCSERHLIAANILDKSRSVSNYKSSEETGILSDVILKYMHDLKVPNGLNELGFSNEDIPDLVKGSLPQHRVIKLSPRSTAEEDLNILFQNSMKVY